MFECLSAFIRSEHGYNTSHHEEGQGSVPAPDDSSSDTSSDSDSDSSQVDCPGPSKHKKTDKKTDKSKDQAPKLLKFLNFNAEEIVHPHSSSWSSPPEVALYIQEHIRSGFDKEVKARHRAECPRPDLDGKVTDTPEIDPTVVTFMNKWSKDPIKGLDRDWRSCQDKLPDLSGPLAKIMELAFLGKESNAPIDPGILVGWAQELFVI
ncbi:hypothetical protein NDU88_002051 [Pleurodeles waltl]|uniref:Uncharacterized protein n=1 Tax=Pleurodeles waltl TaxID=8319 RepID=A0AAV7QBK6_PLEWA|nr:hypothetical protein NDU88_002051 [Pleurodeles waltl]